MNTPRSSGSVNKEGGPPALPEAKPSSLSIRVPEIKPLTVDTPEERNREFALSEKNFNTLVNTVTYHYGIIDKMKAAGDPTLVYQNNFYDAFKEFCASQVVDLKDPDKLKQAASDFLHQKMGKEGSGQIVLSVLKLAQTEITTIQAASGSLYAVEKRDKKYKDIVSKERTLTVTEDGAVEEVKEHEKAWWQASGKKELRSIKFKVKGGAGMDLQAGNTLLNASQRGFLKNAGWAAGVNTVLDDRQIDALEERMSAVAQLEIELYTKSGLKDLSQIQLNFIKPDNGGGSYSGRKYSDPRTAYFLGERSVGADMSVILLAEAEAITADVKTKVKTELDKVRKENEQKSDRKVAVQLLQERIKQIEKDAQLEDFEKEGKKNAIQKEIDRLNSNGRLFVEQAALPGEIVEVRKTEDEALQKVDDLHVRTGVARDDLIKWSSTNSAEPESWRSIELKIKQFKEQRVSIQEQIDDLKAELKDYAAPAPKLGVIEHKDPVTGAVIATENPHPTDITQVEEYARRKKDLQDKIDALRRKIDTDIVPGTGKSLKDNISDLNQKFTDRKHKVEEDPATKEVCDAYHKAKADVKKKEDRKTYVDATIAALPAGENTVALIKDKLRTEREKLEHAEELSGQDKYEIQAIKALIPIFEDTSVEKTSNLFKRLDYGEKIDTHYTPEWNSYPDAVKRLVHVLWGDEVMMGYPDKKELTDNIKVLLRSTKYLDLVIDKMEATVGPTFAVSAFKGAGTTDGLYNDVAEVFVPGTIIAGINPTAINKSLMDSIVDTMRETAVNVKKI